MAKMHPNEFPIDVSLVRQLLIKQFPLWADLPLKPVLSTGTDNALYRLGNHLVVRLPRIGWAVENVDKEFEWLPKIASYLPISIPIPLTKGAPTENYPYPWSVYTWLDGSNPTVGHISNPTLLAHDLVQFLQAMHRIDLPNGPLSNRGVPLERKDGETRRALKQLEGIIDIETATALWDRSLSISKWSKPPVWVHGDLSPGNLLIQKGRLSAVIDFGNVGVGDPACDLIIAWNLLPASMRYIFCREVGLDEATWQRGLGWALSNALIALPYYKDTNPVLAGSARHVLQQLIEDHQRQFIFHFAPLKLSQRLLVYNWLEQTHIKEWVHGIGLQSTLTGIEDFLQGGSSTTYWIGYDRATPFAFFITSPLGEDAITLDVFIYDLSYLGKKLAVPLIHEFLIDQFPNVKKVFIDPEATNTRAIHVYKKAGFKTVGEFIANWHPVLHYQMELNMSDLLTFNTEHH